MARVPGSLPGMRMPSENSWLLSCSGQPGCSRHRGENQPMEDFSHSNPESFPLGVTVLFK